MALTKLIDLVDVEGKLDLSNTRLSEVLAALGPDATADTVLSVLQEIRDEAPGPITGTVSVSNFPATQEVVGTVAISNPFSGDVTDRAARLLGHVTVDNFPATQPVSGTVNIGNLPATQPVSGTVTISNPFGGDVTDRAARLLGHVTVDNFPATQAITAAALPLPAGAATEATVARRFAGGKTTRAQRINTLGDNPIVTPATGKRLRLVWLGLSSSENNGSEMLVVVRLGATVIYRWFMGAPGAFSHWEPVEGAVDEALVVNLTSTTGGVAEPIEVNYTYEEIT